MTRVQVGRDWVGGTGKLLAMPPIISRSVLEARGWKDVYYGRNPESTRGQRPLQHLVDWT